MELESKKETKVKFLTKVSKLGKKQRLDKLKNQADIDWLKKNKPKTDDAKLALAEVIKQLEKAIDQRHRALERKQLKRKALEEAQTALTDRSQKQTVLVTTLSSNCFSKVRRYREPYKIVQVRTDSFSD